MKVRTISRDPELYERGKNTEAPKFFRNLNPEIHPFEKAREYQRALNSVKLDKVFAKPFLHALSGHMEGIYCMSKHSTRLSCVLSGACDGEVRIWNVASKACNVSLKSVHQGFVRGLTVTPSGLSFLSCGTDGLVKLWPLQFDVIDGLDVDERPYENVPPKPLSVYKSDEGLNAIDHQYGTEVFATCSSVLQLWDVNRSHPVSTFSWGVETIHTLRWNAAERDVVATSASDLTITLYDTRAKSPLKKVVLNGRSNSICWNPREPMYFTCANEDHNLYTFDMRFLDKAVGVHTDFVSSVMSVDYSPTGREFVAGGYDKTLRIFKANENQSREVYHTQRMGRVFSVLFSPDGHFVMSGSDDSNIRLWKAQASQPLAMVHPAVRQKLDYQARLKNRYRHMPEIRKIDRHRHQPKAVHSAKRQKHVMLSAAKEKLRRVKVNRSVANLKQFEKSSKEAAVRTQVD